MARLHHRESQLFATYSDDDNSSDGYDVPPHLSDTSDSDDLPHTYSLCEKDKVYVDDSLPRSITSGAKRKLLPKPAGCRKSTSDSDMVRHQRHDSKGKQTAMVQPIQHAPRVPQHGIVRQASSTPHNDVTKVL